MRKKSINKEYGFTNANQSITVNHDGFNVRCALSNIETKIEVDKYCITVVHTTADGESSGLVESTDMSSDKLCCRPAEAEPEELTIDDAVAPETEPHVDDDIDVDSRSADDMLDTDPEHAAHRSLTSCSSRSSSDAKARRNPASCSSSCS
jgi:hypothetical protein